jgi:hypothetical protein
MIRYCAACHEVAEWTEWLQTLKLGVLDGQLAAYQHLRYTCPTRGCTNTYDRETLHTRAPAAAATRTKKRGAPDHDSVFPRYQRYQPTPT